MKRHALTLGIVALIAAAPASAYFYAGDGPGYPPRVCMNRALWSAGDGKRPCVRVASLYEDGSARVVQESFGNRRRVVCVLQNPEEVRRAYLARCARTR